MDSGVAEVAAAAADIDSKQAASTPTAEVAATSDLVDVVQDCNIAKEVPKVAAEAEAAAAAEAKVAQAQDKMEELQELPQSTEDGPCEPKLKSHLRPKDELLLTLGWGSKKLEEESKKSRQCTVADISLSLGSSGGGEQVTATSLPTRSVHSVSNYSNDTTTKSFVHNPSCSLTHTSFDELNSSASQYVSYDQGNNEQSVYQGSIFGSHKHVSFKDTQQQQQQQQQQTRTMTTATNNTSETGRWNSNNLEKYQALFPDLKEGFRAKYAGTRRTRSNRTSTSIDEQGSRQRHPDRRIGLYDIAADPVAVVAHKLQELPDIFLEDLKKSLTEMLSSVDKRDEFLMLQRILQRRGDLTSENLFLAHRTQLEILVAMRTGIQAFLLRDNPLSTSALVEIFLQKRCRNFACQNQLPADDCDCQFCSQKEGFCNACMCIACSKFDFMANTCRWVGCDFCLHWCHTDCGIRLSYIKPGNVKGKDGDQQEMQFVCVACSQASDLFGFVKEVFTNYAKDWSPEVLRQELDCIQRIFRRSQDLRGKQLCWVAEQMLRKIEGCTDTRDICDTMIQFFADGRLEFDKASGNPALKPAALSKEAAGLLRVGGYAAADTNVGRTGTASLHADMQYNRPRASDVEGVEGIIQMKQAEARMFQMRAEEARLEAEALRKILVVKSKKIDEEYTSKMHKLRIEQAVDKRKRSMLEYQMLEQGFHEFNSMKSQLVTDVQEVLRRMDNVKRQRMR